MFDSCHCSVCVCECVSGGVSLTVLQDLTYVTACRHDGFAVVQVLDNIVLVLLLLSPARAHRHKDTHTQ